jgi:hypothetical protein
VQVFGNDAVLFTEDFMEGVLSPFLLLDYAGPMEF